MLMDNLLSNVKGFCECASRFHGNTWGLTNNWNKISHVRRLICAVLGSNVTTRSVVIRLTTFLSNVVVASLFSEWNSFSVVELFYWPSSAVASTQATFLWTPLKPSAAELSAVVWNKRISQWRHRHTRPSMQSRQKHFRMTVTSWTNPWADAYNVSAAGEYRQVSLSELRYLLERWQRVRRKLIPRDAKDKLK